jgi:ABC-type glycerol-3-phosphate transport system substrate-binding protein
MATRSKDGFPVDPTTWQEILAAAEKLKLPRAGVEQAAQRA